MPNQRPEQVFELIQRHVLQNTPAGVRVTLKKHSEACPYVAPINHPVMQLAKQAYTYGYGKEALWIRAGGSIPVVEMLAGCFGIPIVLMGFGLPTANVHGPNEHFSLTNFEKGWRTLSWFFINMEKVFGNL
nr:M20/M25/M40 family metallo-hydrolase [Anoxybacillus sp.]